MSFKPIKSINCLCIVGNTHMLNLTYSAFRHLSEHQTSFQVFCRYVNSSPVLSPVLTLTLCFRDLDVLHERLQESEGKLDALRKVGCYCGNYCYDVNVPLHVRHVSSTLLLAIVVFYSITSYREFK